MVASTYWRDHKDSPPTSLREPLYIRICRSTHLIAQQSPDPIVDYDALCTLTDLEFGDQDTKAAESIGISIHNLDQEHLIST